MRENELWITNAKLILPDEILDGHLYICNGRIAAITTEFNEDEVSATAQVVDAEGLYVMPGMIETHSDAIEKEIQPRPGIMFPLEMAMAELERKMAGLGITTYYHSISSSDGTPVRNDEFVATIIHYAAKKLSEPSMIRHRVHLRYEITNVMGIAMAHQLIERGLIHLLSLMDHTPGQGQYQTTESLRDYLIGTEQMNTTEAEDIVDQLIAYQKQIDWGQLKKLTQFANKNGVSLASHDDDTRDKVKFMKELGIGISEFPVSLEAANEASHVGMYVSVGAPNVIRGSSHNNNMRAIDAINSGIAHILCSDYHPPSLLPAVMKIIESSQIELPHAVRMVTLNPAEALGLDAEYGSIELGKIADLVLLEMRDGYPIVRKTWIDGIGVYQSDYF